MNAILRNKLTKEIIKRGKYPRADLGPVVGLDQELEWVLIEVMPQPTADETKNVVAQETEVEVDGIKKIIVDFIITDKSAEEIAEIEVERRRFAFESQIQANLHTFSQEYGRPETRLGSLAKLIKSINDTAGAFKDG